MSDSNLPSVFVIGDSISMHYGPFLQAGLAGSFRYFRKSNDGKEASVNLDIPQGANGGESTRVLNFLRHWVSQGPFRPDVFLINCGLHDIKTDNATGKILVSLDEYQENLRQIVAVTREIGSPLIWMRTTHSVDAIHNSRGIEFSRYAKDLEAYNSAADAVMADEGVPVIDLCTFTKNLGSDENLFCDHVHFNEPIRERQGAFLAGWLIGWQKGRGR